VRKFLFSTSKFRCRYIDARNFDKWRLRKHAYLGNTQFVLQEVSTITIHVPLHYLLYSNLPIVHLSFYRSIAIVVIIVESFVYQSPLHYHSINDITIEILSYYYSKRTVSMMRLINQSISWNVSRLLNACVTYKCTAKHCAMCSSSSSVRPTRSCIVLRIKWWVVKRIS